VTSAIKDLYDQVHDDFVVNIATPYGVQVQYDNEAFVLNESGLGITETWIRFSLLIGERARINANTNPKRYRQFGNAFIAIYGNDLAGRDKVIAVADYIDSAYTNKIINGVTYRTAQITQPKRERRWFRLTVDLPFYQDIAVEGD